jgi:hypothetical protein
MRTIKRDIIGDYRVDDHIFSEVDDELPVHIHTAATTHLSFLTQGELQCLGHQRGRILHIGDAILWGIGEPHGFRATKVPAVLKNIRHKSQFQMLGPHDQTEIMATRGQGVWYFAAPGRSRLPALVIELHSRPNVVDLDVLEKGTLIRTPTVSYVKPGVIVRGPYCHAPEADLDDPIDLDAIANARWAEAQL